MLAVHDYVIESLYSSRRMPTVKIVGQVFREAGTEELSLSFSCLRWVTDHVFTVYDFWKLLKLLGHMASNASN